MIKKEKGFTLIELLIVVAIILIIAAIAIPNLLRARMAANEASAVGSLRTYNTAEAMYFSTYQVGYPTDFAFLGPAVGTPPAPGCTAAAPAGLLDAVLGACESYAEERIFLRVHCWHSACRYSGGQHLYGRRRGRLCGHSQSDQHRHDGSAELLHR